MERYEEILGARRLWIAALTAIPKASVFALASDLAAKYAIRPLAVSQAGLALLPLRESVEHSAFYLGEIPLSSGSVEIETQEGVFHGAALVMADDAEFADALAICDGVLANRLEGWTDVADQVEHGLEKLNHEARIRKTMLERSRVNFSLLNEEGEA